MPLYPPKVLRGREHASTPCSSIVFSLDSHLGPLRNLGARQEEPWLHMEILQGTH